MSKYHSCRCYFISGQRFPLYNSENFDSKFHHYDDMNEDKKNNYDLVYQVESKKGQENEEAINTTPISNRLEILPMKSTSLPESFVDTGSEQSDKQYFDSPVN